MTLDADTALLLGELGLRPCRSCSAWCSGCSSAIEDRVVVFVALLAALDRRARRKVELKFADLPAARLPQTARRQLDAAIAYLKTL